MRSTCRHAGSPDRGHAALHGKAAAGPQHSTCHSRLAFCRVHIAEHVGCKAIPRREHLPKPLHFTLSAAAVVLQGQQSSSTWCMVDARVHQRGAAPWPELCSMLLHQRRWHVGVKQRVLQEQHRHSNAGRRLWRSRFGGRRGSHVDGCEGVEQVCAAAGGQTLAAAAHHEHHTVRLGPPPCLGSYGAEAAHGINHQASMQGDLHRLVSSHRRQRTRASASHPLAAANALCTGTGWACAQPPSCLTWVPQTLTCARLLGCCVATRSSEPSPPAPPAAALGCFGVANCSATPSGWTVASWKPSPSSRVLQDRMNAASARCRHLSMY